MTQNRRPIKGNGVTCIKEGCDQPRHKNYTMCIDHRREYENTRKRERNARKRALMPSPQKPAKPTFTPLNEYPDLLIVQRLADDKTGNVVLYKPVRVIPPSEARMNYSDSNRVARNDNVLVFKAVFNPKTKVRRGRYE